MQLFSNLSWVAASISLLGFHHQANAQNDGDTFLASVITITNTDGSSFTELLEPFTDATGGLSTLTVTVNTVARGYAEPTASALDSPLSSSAPAPVSAPDSGSVFTVEETTIIDPNGSSFTALLEPVTDATGGVSTLTVTVDAIAGGVAEPTITTIAPPPVTTNANSVELLPPATSLVTSTASDGSVGIVPVPVPVEGGSGSGGGGGK